MCGRFTQLLTWAQLRRLMRLTSPPIELPLRYNIAPTQRVPVVRHEGGGRSLALLRWGLVPAWAKDLAIGSSMINARGETLAAKPAFRSAFKRRRCLVPASGFYEWDKVSGGKAKQPIYITASDEGPLVFGGVWESWASPDGDTVETFAIVTTAPNEMMSRFHDRMPLILDPDDHDAWLDPEREDASALVRPYPSELMLARPVSTRVNSPKNDDPSLIEPVEPRRAEGLFG
ncbi:MAG: SOS response-associated peptidase [Phycisphaeraceae bacterium]|nr:SOS response-associated peptidase [Phycisphaeraceae bacterium]